MTTTTIKPGKAAATKEPVGPAHSRPGHYVTGFCGIGNHEGTKNKAANGALFKACPVGGRSDAGRLGIILCNCSCHDMTREMEEMSGVQFPPLLINQNPPIKGIYLRLPHGVTGDGGTSGSGGSGASGGGFRPTPTGRAARGQLEEQVRHFICSQIHAAGEDMITLLGLQPMTIAKGISRDDPPSTGAIYSVLKRWEGHNLVNLEEGPFRFSGFTDRGKRELYRAPRQ